MLAIAEQGSASQAAGLLDIDPSTVIRRLNDFEALHAVKLFERHQSGLKPTQACRDLLAMARPIEGAVLSIEREILGQDSKLEGSIAVTTTDAIAHGLLGPHIKSFCDTYPAIAIDLNVTNTRLDLQRLDADLSVRPSLDPPADLIGRNVSGLAFAIYAPVDDDSNWSDRTLVHYPWIGFSHDLVNSPAGAWMQHIERDAKIVTRGNSFVMLRELVAAGIGLAVLPCFVGDDDERLQRVASPLTDVTCNVWVLTHRDLRNSARVRALSEHLARCLRRQRKLLEGRSAD